MVGIAQADCAEPDASGGSSGCDTKLCDEQFCRCPGCGAVAWCGSDPDQYARRRRDRALGRDFRPLSEWRSDTDGERGSDISPPSYPHADLPPSTATHLL